MRQELHVTSRLHDQVHADSEFCEETVGQIIYDDANDFRRRLTKIGRATIIDVAKIIDEGIDLFAGLVIDKRTTLENQRHGGFRHASGARNVHNACPDPVHDENLLLPPT